MLFSCQKIKPVVGSKSYMRAIFLTICLLAGVMTAPAAQPARFVKPDQQVARELLESVYNTWRIGMVRKNEAAFMYELIDGTEDL